MEEHCLESIKDQLFSHIFNHPVRLTYIAIGGANNGYQQLPKYLLKYLQYFNIRIIIIDPNIEPIPKLFCDSDNYLKYPLQYEHNDSFFSNELIDGLPSINLYNLLITSNIEFITIKAHSYHNSVHNGKDNDFYKQLCSHTLAYNNILLVSNYTGYDDSNFHKDIYNLFQNESPMLKTQFNESILLDSYYGRQLGCRPDLDNQLNHPIITFNNYKLKIYNLYSLELNEYQKYIDECMYALFGTEYEDMIKNHISECIKTNIVNFKNNDFVKFRKLIKELQDAQLSFEDTANSLVKLYLELECNIINLFVTISNIVSEPINIIELQINMRTTDRYNCFNKYIRIINEANLYKITYSPNQITKSYIDI